MGQVVAGQTDTAAWVRAQQVGRQALRNNNRLAKLRRAMDEQPLPTLIGELLQPATDELLPPLKGDPGRRLDERPKGRAQLQRLRLCPLRDRRLGGQGRVARAPQMG